MKEEHYYYGIAYCMLKTGETTTDDISELVLPYSI